MMYTIRAIQQSCLYITLGLLIGCNTVPSSTTANTETDNIQTSANASDTGTSQENTKPEKLTKATEESNHGTTVSESSEQPTDENSPEQPTDGPISEHNTAFDLAPGNYCYHLETETETSHLRLAFDGNDLIYGDGRTTVHNEQVGYYTSYAQKFSGTLSDQEADLNITTWIEYDVQTAQETWTLSNTDLNNQNQVLPIVDCEQVNLAFQDINGLEARDLTDGATAIHNQSIRFAPGTSGATVSNSVIRGERDLYTLGAQGGQQMTVSITALEDNAVFDVISPSGYILTVEDTEEDLFLPHNGEYQIIVGGTRGNATYELTVDIE